jgi:hypothetical protein
MKDDFISSAMFTGMRSDEPGGGADESVVSEDMAGFLPLIGGESPTLPTACHCRK